ncbi:NEL-type E3 ubiquitin ligase domain-containing protein [Pseudomonas sp. ANT_H12B]|uniref:NEL-type E3 ubiquitin ligase domain-containing protein n=1 Tax=Pseudomonas sp. ANT_H12B TaxID=2597348 RepID=UPI0015B48F1D|nr:NEL-type E3 ubiquitin ligase domain-containing protein [Pseudomonas sp. ANT_H12B]
MKRAIEASWASQNESDKTLKKLQAIETFAEPLLVAALKDKYNITLNVRTTCLRLYCPKGIVVGFDVRTLSLLEAALHNFEVKETRAGYFARASDFITQPSDTGQFDVVPIKDKLSVEAFAALCRELDIGARYQAYLKAFMGFTNPVARAVLKIKVQTSHKDALRAASVLALMKQDIDLETHQMLLKLVEGHRALTLRGKPMHCYGLTMMDAALTGIVLIAPDLDRSLTTERIIAYVPHDPLHPIKQYPSTASFAAELAAQLRAPEYQRFFSQFVPHQQRGTFFFQLNDALSRVQWHTPTPFEQTPTWRAEPVQTPNLRMANKRISADFWTHDFHQKLNKILNDARAMAVPTDDEDEKSRWARWDSFQKIALAVLEVAAFVAAPFVPFLGELMLAYTAYQLLDETFEGIVEWSEGQRSEAAAHLIGVAESLIQLGTLVAGGKLLGTLLPLKSSPFVERMKVVEMSNGQSRLWQPDLEVYRRPLVLEENATPDAKGIYRHEGRDVVALDDKYFVVTQQPRLDEYLVQHPTRADAYSPRLAHNGAGAWTHEAERPQAWQGVTLMRRLGHSVESFSDQTLEQIRVASGVEEDVLRRLHVEHDRPPALLLETIKRFKADQEVQTFIEQLSSDDPEVYGNPDVQAQLQQLKRDGTWPESRAEIARLANAGKPALVDARYWLNERAADTNVSPNIQLLRNDFAQMPRTVMDELLREATPAELRQMDEGQIPLRLRQASRAAMVELRLSRAYEGLYLQSGESLDTWRLALHSLEQLAGWPAEVRIEIRGVSFDGPLLDGIGPDESSIRKVLVFNDQGSFQAYDTDGESLHGLGDFYTSMLQALPDASREALGYEIGQGIRLKEALQKAPIKQEAFRAVLADHPVHNPDPVVMGLRGGMQGYELMEVVEEGAPGPEERFKTLYPGASTDSFAAFMQSFASKTQALASIRQRELGFEGLSKALDSWVAIERGEYLPMDQRYHKGRFAKALKQCWQAAGESLPQGYSLNLDFHWTSDFLEYLPVLNADFRHVSALQFRYTALTTDITGFLGYFPNLRALDLSENALVTPPRLRENLPALERLNLSNNQLTLTAQSVADLEGLTRLQSLGLGNNPALALLPDVSRMPDLDRLDLHNTGSADWPPGLFALPRPRSFALDLQGNPVAHIPDVAPGSDEARLIARTRLSRDQLTDQSRQQFQDYMRSVGYDPTRSYPPKGEETSEYWLEGVEAEQRVSRQTTWDELEREPNAQGFFEVLEQLSESADYVDDAYRPGLTQRVWRMLDAVAENTPLREELFRMAVNPDSCADAGAQIFNEMGSKVLVHEAYRAGNPARIEASLITLAKGKSRLDGVNEIARATIQGRLAAGETFQAFDEDGDITGTIDEVEVYLAFQTGLADRLELPWQSRDMLFRQMAEVGEEQIDQAYQSILALEAGEGLVNRMIEQGFWRKYLKSRYPREFAQNSAVYNARSEALLDQQLAGSVSQQEYERGIAELADARKGLLRTLTRTAMEKRSMF